MNFFFRSESDVVPPVLRVRQEVLRDPVDFVQLLHLRVSDTDKVLEQVVEIWGSHSMASRRRPNCNERLSLNLQGLWHSAFRFGRVAEDGGGNRLAYRVKQLTLQWLMDGAPGA